MHTLGCVNPTTIQIKIIKQTQNRIYFNKSPITSLQYWMNEILCNEIEKKSYYVKMP